MFILWVSNQSIVSYFQGSIGFSKNAAKKKMVVFRVAAPCNLVEFYQHFRLGCCCLHHQSDE